MLQPSLVRESVKKKRNCVENLVGQGRGFVQATPWSFRIGCRKQIPPWTDNFIEGQALTQAWKFHNNKHILYKTSPALEIKPENHPPAEKTKQRLWPSNIPTLRRRDATDWDMETTNRFVYRSKKSQLKYRILMDFGMRTCETSGWFWAHYSVVVLTNIWIYLAHTRWPHTQNESKWSASGALLCKWVFSNHGTWKQQQLRMARAVYVCTPQSESCVYSCLQSSICWSNYLSMAGDSFRRPTLLGK